MNRTKGVLLGNFHKVLILLAVLSFSGILLAETIPYDGGTYTGELLNGVPHGQGIATWPDGSKYVGEWRDGERHGQGLEILENGNKYVGEWKNGKPSGFGKATEGAHGFLGEFKNGEFHGDGILTSGEGEFLGKFENGNIYPEGPAYLKIFTGQLNGASYIGEVKNTKLHGFGLLSFPPGGFRSEKSRTTLVTVSD